MCRNDGVLDGLIHLRLQVAHVHDIGVKSRNSVDEFLRGTVSGHWRVKCSPRKPCGRREHRPDPSLPHHRAYAA